MSGIKSTIVAAFSSRSKFGRWLVVDARISEKKVLCLCDCGTTKLVNVYNLVGGKSTSCGCDGNRGPMTHGLSKDPAYRTWKTIKARCHNPNHKNFPDYGGRGIRVCDRWMSSPELFISDMGERPSLSHSIERIDPNGNYEPGNCTWATQREQMRNTRRSCVLTHQGMTKTVAEWAETTGLKESTVYHRIAAGWSAEMAIGTPARKISGR